MDWRAIRFDWNQVRAFLATAEEGSFSAAARATGQAQPTLGRQVAALEADLGVTLFERVGRGLMLTPAGVELLAHVRAMGDAAMRISLVAAGQSQEVAGEVRVSASDVLAAHVLPGHLGPLAEIAPALSIEILAENRLSDLMRREADIALRHVRPTEPDLIARRLRDDSGHLYASEAWVARHGRPRRLADLEGASFIGYDAPDRMAPELEIRGIRLPPMRWGLRSASGVAMWEMVRAGLGVGIMSAKVAEATGGAVRLDLADFPVVDVPVWLTTHRELHTARRIRVVFDFLAEALG